MLDSIMVLTSLYYIVISSKYYITQGEGCILPSSIFLLSTAIFLSLPQLYSYFAWGVSVEDNDLRIFYYCLIVTYLPYSILRFNIKKVRAILTSGNVRYDDYCRAYSNFRTNIYSTLIVIIGMAIVMSYLNINVAVSVRLEELVLILLTAIYLFNREKTFLLSIVWLVFLIAIYIYFVLYIFTGNGRLALMGLFLSGFSMLLISIGGSKRLKVLSIASIPGLLVVLGAIRAEVDNVSVYDVLEHGEGLQSMIAPYTTFVDLYNSMQAFPDFAYNNTFWPSILFWVPRSIWAGKSVGFGSELVKLLGSEELFDIGHSMAAGYWGELYWNGGAPLLIVGSIVIAIALSKLDRVYASIISNPSLEDKMYYILLIVILSSGLGHYVWVGSFTFLAQDVFKVIILMVVKLLLSSLKSSSQINNH